MEAAYTPVWQLEPLKPELHTQKSYWLHAPPPFTPLQVLLSPQIAHGANPAVVPLIPVIAMQQEQAKREGTPKYVSCQLPHAAVTFSSPETHKMGLTYCIRDIQGNPCLQQTILALFAMPIVQNHFLYGNGKCKYSETGNQIITGNKLKKNIKEKNARKIGLFVVKI